VTTPNKGRDAADAAVRPRRGGSYAVGRARRARILHVAMEEFAENGYRGASLARIAERAELSQPGLLHHFHTKEELLAATLDLRDQMDAERFTDAAGAPLTGVAAMEALVDLVERNQRIPGLVQLFTVLSAESVTVDHPAHDWARNRYRRTRRFIADSIRGGITSGEFRPDVDPEAHAFRLVAIMDGLQQQWLLDADAVDMAAVFGAYLRETLESIRTHH